MGDKKISYSTYAVSLNFDEGTESYIRGLIQELAEASGNFYMTDHEVPPHLTLGIFHCENSDLKKLESRFDTFLLELEKLKGEELAIDIEGIDTFSNKVIFLKPEKNSSLIKLNKALHKLFLSSFEAGDNRNYLPENWFPHIALGVKLSASEFERGLEALKKKKKLRSRGSFSSISLALCNPYEVNKTFSFRIHYHLPGLFEFYEFYRLFLPIFYEHKEWFYPWCDIGSLYGSPEDCLWGGGRVSSGKAKPLDVKNMMEDFGLSARLTFSNSLLEEKHLADKACNQLCSLFSKMSVPAGAIVHSELLTSYIKKNYPDLYLVSSTTKVITDFDAFVRELDRPEFKFVVPDFRLNRKLQKLKALSQSQKDKLEFLCNECCSFSCSQRKSCYENVSRLNLGLKPDEYQCRYSQKGGSYKFSLAMQNPAFIGLKDIKRKYRRLGFSNFKLEGRGLGSALLLEFILYYMTKPEYQLQLREAVYLDSMLDLF